MEIPPPVAPEALFHTVWVGGGPSLDIVVPPTPVTSGWLAGSSTASEVLPSEALQSSEPESPEEANTDCPCVTASSNSVLSDWTMLASPGSHRPHEVEITCALFWLRIELYVSYAPVFVFGPW